MRVKRIYIEWEPVTEADQLLCKDGEKHVVFENGRGMAVTGALVPHELSLLMAISEWLKEHWKRNGPNKKNDD